LLLPVLALFACVSTPLNEAAEDKLSEGSALLAEEAAKDEETLLPEVLGKAAARVFYEAQPEAVLPEPSLKKEAGPLLDTDITVLSLVHAPVLGPFPLPEPFAPDLPAPAALPDTKAADAQAAMPASPADAEPVQPKPASPTPAAAKPPESAPALGTQPAKPAAQQATQPAPKATPTAPQAATPTAPQAAKLLPAASPSSVAAVESASKAAPALHEEKNAARGESLELRFPGSGWIYLGDEDGKDGMRYQSRRFENNEAVFAIKPEANGEFVLRFQRQNPLSGGSEARLIKINVTSASPAAAPTAATSAESSRTDQAKAGQALEAGAAKADAAKAVPPESLSLAGVTNESAIQPAADKEQSAAVTARGTALDAIRTTPDELLAYAKAELDAKRMQSAIAALDKYLSLYPFGSDEAFYLYGIAWEQDSPFRDIKKSHAAYKKVRDEYPRSQYWQKANERAAFLEKFYFGLR